jgi:hypothetical protein
VSKALENSLKNLSTFKIFVFIKSAPSKLMVLFLEINPKFKRKSNKYRDLKDINLSFQSFPFFTFPSL